MKNSAKLQQDRVVTAIVGSYPKPKYLYPKSGRKLLDSLGLEFAAYENQLGKSAFKELVDKAALQAITDQNTAGIDLVTDGEERRGHYVLDILKHLDGIDFKNLKKVAYRGGILQREVPVVRGKIAYKKKFMVDEFTFTAKHAKGFAKIGLPGPSTVVDCVADEHYNGDLEQMAFDYAEAIHHEVGNLVKAGCKVIQFDDPVLLRFPDRAKKWGLKALERCFAGYEDKLTVIVHICRGYPNKPLEKKGVTFKANKDYYKDILQWFSKSKIDAVSIEGEESKLDLSILPAIGKKTVMLGVLDVGIKTVESVSAIAKRGKEALKYLPKNQLILAPDCGMIELSRTAAKNKLRNMAVAARQLNGEK